MRSQPAALKPLLETKAIVGHNLAFEFAFLLLDRYGIELKGELFDTLIAARILSNEALFDDSTVGPPS